MSGLVFRRPGYWALITSMGFEYCVLKFCHKCQKKAIIILGWGWYDLYGSQYMLYNCIHLLNARSCCTRLKSLLWCIFESEFSVLYCASIGQWRLGIRGTHIFSLMSSPPRMRSTTLAFAQMASCLDVADNTKFWWVNHQNESQLKLGCWQWWHGCTTLSSKEVSWVI